MAGIWERITPGDDRLAVHLVTSALHLADLGAFTSAQILSGLNATLETPLDQNAVNDLQAMLTELSGLDNASKTRYMLGVQSLNVAVETGLLTSESTYRNTLGIA
jgi:hypothetical protein